MKTYHILGHKISDSDQKAFDHFYGNTPNDWTRSALKGMINKAKKNIIRVWFDYYRSKQTKEISMDPAILIPAIIAMDGFHSGKYDPDEKRSPERVESQTIEIWADGFEIEDWEDLALKAFYKDPIAMLKYFLENNIAICKKDLYEAIKKDKSYTTISPIIDEAIQTHVSKVEYKTAYEEPIEIGL